MQGARPAAIISICPDGPVLVRGDFELRDLAGDSPVDARRRVIALCRCGRSQIKPFCDGSHAQQPRSGTGEVGGH
jgi:CDGSH-type Zn-finger protein